MVLSIIGIVTVVLPNKCDLIDRPNRIIMLLQFSLLRVLPTATVSVEDLSAVTPALNFICSAVCRFWLIQNL